VVRWLDDAARITTPLKSDQDGLDACICLLAAVYLAESRECLMVGNRVIETRPTSSSLMERTCARNLRPAARRLVERHRSGCGRSIYWLQQREGHPLVLAKRENSSTTAPLARFP
jgi:hypothetical protein